MEPIFTDKQLNNMSREDLISLMKIVQAQTKKKDTEIQLLKDKQKELEFLNAMLSDRLTLAQRKQFGASSEKYAEGYEQMNLFNEAEASADAETEERKRLIFRYYQKNIRLLFSSRSTLTIHI